jgi:hypothetical protein
MRSLMKIQNMKNFLTVLLLCSVYTGSFAKPVDINMAMKTGQNFISNYTQGKSFKASNALQLAYISAEDATGSKLVYFYVFNSDNGFVIVSADDDATPVLGYSDEGTFSGGNIPFSVAKWLENYKSQIREIIEKHIAATPEIKQSWLDLQSNNPRSAALAVNTVNPLLTTKWNQLPYFNDMCPYDNLKGKHTVTGCVATAMAQVLKFWNWPSTGMGFHSYNDLNYGIQSASFGGTTYNWSAMPAVVSSANESIATLLYHCGVSVNMTYGVDESSAYVISAQSPITYCAEYALKTYFGYKATLSGIQRSNYTDGQWISILENELNAGRPVIYSGFGTGGGHCFVCDGFDLSNYMHINWGWGGAYNAYFQVSALNPAGIGTGGGSGGYNDGQQIIVGIEPAKNVIAGDLRLYDYVTISADSIIYGKPFSVKTNIKNYGSIAFAGDLCAAVFDTSNILIDYVSIKLNQSLSAGSSYASDIVFSTLGSYTLLPGKYSIGIYYRPTGGDWAIISNSGSYSNTASLKVISNSNIEIFKPFQLSSSILTTGKPMSVTVTLANAGSTKFTGNFNLSLFNFDGANVCNIETISNDTLNSGFNNAKELTFSNSKLTVTTGPGSYFLALLYKPTGSAVWQIAGSMYYQNPIKVIVKAPDLLPDQYEQDDDIASAYSFTPVYSGNTAYVNTDGSNIHTPGDIDYYKIYLPYGYDFTINANIDDSRYNPNGKPYTLDAVFSYSVDEGKSWSNTYDFVMGEAIIKGGKTIYFKVAPYFGGQSGTYLLEINISSAKNGVPRDQLLTDKLINMYPNPVQDVLNIDLTDILEGEKVILLTDMEGRVLISKKITTNQSSAQLQVTEFCSGMYNLSIQCNAGIIRRNIVIER